MLRPGVWAIIELWIPHFFMGNKLIYVVTTSLGRNMLRPYKK